MTTGFQIGSIYVAEPLWLLLALPCIVAFIFWRKRKSEAVYKHTSIAALQKNNWKARMHKALPWLYTAALCAMLLGLCQPQQLNTSESDSGSGIDIVLSMDVSGSMLANDFDPDRLEASKAVAARFVSDRAYDRIGLVAFSGESFTLCPLTTDHNVLLQQIQNLRSGILKDGTAIGMGLATAVDRLRTSDAKSKIVILLTDGVNNLGLIDPRTALEIAKALNIKVYTIGVGSVGQANMPVGKDAFDQWVFAKSEVELDEELLQDIANGTGGKYFRATDNTSLSKIYSDIDRLEKSKVDIETHVHRKELFHYFLLAAFWLIVAALVAQYGIARSVARG